MIVVQLVVMDLMKDVMELWIEMLVKISECNLGFSCGIIPKCIHKDKAKPVLLYFLVG